MKVKPDLKELLNFDIPNQTIKEFHQKTKIRKGFHIALSRYPKSWKVVDYKSYFRFQEIRLPKPKDLSQSLSHCLTERKSCRNFRERRLYLSKISSILAHSLGLINSTDDLKRRVYPSAGPRYPIEAYIISVNTALSQGVYHYYVKNHSLELMTHLRSFSMKKFFIHPFFKNASCFIVLTGVFSRSTIKYGVGAYLRILLEAGHIGQNIYLTSSALGLGCCAIGGFGNYEIDKLLDIDGVSESSIYMFALGKSAG